MADSPYTRTLPETRLELEQLIEAAIARLDDLDGDPDVEITCEDEGAQCDDEGAIEEDGNDSEDETRSNNIGRCSTPAEDAAKAAACVAAVEGLRAIQRRKGHKRLTQPVRVVAGVVFKRSLQNGGNT